MKLENLVVKMLFQQDDFLDIQVDNLIEKLLNYEKEMDSNNESLLVESIKNLISNLSVINLDSKITINNVLTLINNAVDMAIVSKKNKLDPNFLPKKLEVLTDKKQALRLLFMHFYIFLNKEDFIKIYQYFNINFNVDVSVNNTNLKYSNSISKDGFSYNRLFEDKSDDFIFYEVINEIDIQSYNILASAYFKAKYESAFSEDLNRVKSYFNVYKDRENKIRITENELLESKLDFSFLLSRNIYCFNILSIDIAYFIETGKYYRIYKCNTKTKETQKTKTKVSEICRRVDFIKNYNKSGRITFLPYSMLKSDENTTEQDISKIIINNHPKTFSGFSILEEYLNKLSKFDPSNLFLNGCIIMDFPNEAFIHFKNCKKEFDDLNQEHESAESIRIRNDLIEFYSNNFKFSIFCTENYKKVVLYVLKNNLTELESEGNLRYAQMILSNIDFSAHNLFTDKSKEKNFLKKFAVDLVFYNTLINEISDIHKEYSVFLADYFHTNIIHVLSNN